MSQEGLFICDFLIFISKKDKKRNFNEIVFRAFTNGNICVKCELMKAVQANLIII